MEPLLKSIVKRKENSQWLSAHYSKLAERYEGEWVAVYDGSVVAHSKKLARMSKELKAKYKQAYGEIAFEFVTKKPIELIL